MKTKIRTILCEPSKEYQRLEIQILDNRYHKKSDYLEIIGYLTFQRNIGEDRYYGLNYYLNTESAVHVVKMGRLATFIAKNSNYNTQPDEIKKLIGAVEHIKESGEFIPASFLGKLAFKVMKNNGEYYSNIFAKDEASAKKKLKKLNVPNTKLVFSHVISTIRYDAILIPLNI